MAGEAVTAMIVADDGGDDPLADRREDREAAAERERKAKVAKLNSQTVNAMEVVRAQQAAKEQGAFDEAAIRALPGVVDVLHSGSATVGGGMVAAGGESGVFRIWKVSDGKLQASFDPPVKDEVAKLAP